jgi:hypothetical protein
MFDIIPMKRKCSMVVVPLLWMDAVLVVVLLLDAEFRSGCRIQEREERMRRDADNGSWFRWRRDVKVANLWLGWVGRW